MPTSPATRSAASLPSPVSSTGCEAELAQLADRLRARGLDGVADDERRARHAVPADGDLAVRAADLDLVALDAPDDADAGPVREGLHGRQRADLGLAAFATAWAIGCSLASSTAPASRSTSARVAPFSGRTSTSSMRPSVTVPVLSRTIVPIRRVSSSTSGPLMRMPSCAPRPVPTMSAVGVASPRAQGHAMMSTATAAENASPASPVTASQPASVASAMPMTAGRTWPRRGRRAAGSAPCRTGPR